ncbi:hypothetical protein F5887DRAFT_958210 [Amanita rubescens]|nr:hypothetical protein F5887DRAFT_958210 [Amanita rubescens]
MTCGNERPGTSATVVANEGHGLIVHIHTLIYISSSPCFLLDHAGTTHLLLRACDAHVFDFRFTTDIPLCSFLISLPTIPYLQCWCHLDVSSNPLRVLPVFLADLAKLRANPTVQHLYTLPIKKVTRRQTQAKLKICLTTKLLMPWPTGRGGQYHYPRTRAFFPSRKVPATTIPTVVPGSCPPFGSNADEADPLLDSLNVRRLSFVLFAGDKNQGNIDWAVEKGIICLKDDNK